MSFSRPSLVVSPPRRPYRLLLSSYIPQRLYPSSFHDVQIQNEAFELLFLPNLTSSNVSRFGHAVTRYSIENVFSRIEHEERKKGGWPDIRLR